MKFDIKDHLSPANLAEANGNWGWAELDKKVELL